ncbi:MAG: hypothetical protein OES10_14815 [Gammaproteobacteria bacterium]|nr:hypothetical protein [Gammaproteobacteria bacterium]MDH3749559.1 hypothetical protein [Gammaproteobacteria bacterium]
MPATTEAITIPTAIPETIDGHTNQGATAATEYMNRRLADKGASCG